MALGLNWIAPTGQEIFGAAVCTAATMVMVKAVGLSVLGGLHPPSLKQRHGRPSATKFGLLDRWINGPGFVPQNGTSPRRVGGLGRRN